MSDQQFQIVLSYIDYQKLKQSEEQSKSLSQEVAKLKEETGTLRQKNREFKYSINICEAFIDYISNECNYIFGKILNMNGNTNEGITQSIYQDFGSYDHIRISSIELRDGLDMYIKKHKGIFDRLQEVEDKFMEMDNSIKISYAKNQQKEEKIKYLEDLCEKERNCSKLRQKQLHIHQYSQELISIKLQLEKLHQQKEMLSQQIQKLMLKNIQLNKQNETLVKRKQNQGQKAYHIKLMIQEYYKELEKNLVTLGGLSNNQIEMVVSNEMKEIVQYINSVTKKVNKAN